MSSDQNQLHGALDSGSNSQLQHHHDHPSLQHQQSGDSNTAPATPSSSSNSINNLNSATTSNSQQQPTAEQPKKAKRKRITPEQLEDLVGLFEKTDTPSFEIREGLAKKLGMTNREIQVWFQNRRAKANRIKINEQAALHHQQHLQQQQMHQQQQQQQQQQQHLQGHHHLGHHHRSNSSSNGFGGPHSVHSSPATPQQPLTAHHHHHQSNGGMSSSSAQESSYGFFGSNGSSSPPMSTPTPRVHHSQHGGQPSRRPASMYSMGSYGHLHQSQQFQQKPGQFQPQHPSSSSSSSSAAHYGPSGTHPHNGGHSHSNSFSQPTGPYGMDIILPTNSSSSVSSSSSQRPMLLPPPINTVPPRRPGQSMEEYEDSRRAHRHERTMSEGHPAGYMSPTSISSISPPPERHMDTMYRDEHDEDSPTSATHASPFVNGGNNSGSANNNRNNTSLASFGLKAMSKGRSEEAEPSVIPRERSSSSAYYNNPTQAAMNRRSYEDTLPDDEHQQFMRDNFNLDTRLVISDEPRPESAIDLLALAASIVQESEEHSKDSKDAEEKRDGLGHLSSSNKRQSFHGPTGYPSKEPFQDDSTRYSSSSMAWEASSPAGSNVDPTPIPRRRGGDDAPYAPRRPRPMTYGGSGLYDHQESQFMPQSPSSSMGSYSRPSSSASLRRLSNRNPAEVGSSGLLLQRGLTRPRRSSSTAASGLMSHMPSSSMPVLPPIISENRLLSPAMVPSPQFGASRLARQDSQGNINSGGATRESPGSDSYSRDSFNESHTSRDDMEDIEDDEAEQRATKRRSGTANSFFGMSVK